MADASKVISSAMCIKDNCACWAPLISQGDASVFIEGPISLTPLVATALLLMMIVPNFRKNREEAFKGEEA